MINVINVEKLNKTFKELKAVDNLSFAVEEGECFGILGPNGAGKTTMMKMLQGKTIRDKNKDTIVGILGFDPLHKELEIKYISGIVPQEDNLDQDLNVIENLLIYSKFYGMKNKIAKKRINELLEFMELTAKTKSIIRQLSGGMKRRLIIVRALLNNPRILFLDEPTTGLDPQIRHLIWDKLRILKRQGVTILLTTHYMEEAFQLCDRIMMMNKGEKILEGNPSDLINDNIEKYVLEVHEKEEAEKCSKHDGVRLDETENRCYFYSDNIKKIEDISKKFRTGGFYMRQSNLEDLFLHITGRNLNE